MYIIFHKTTGRTHYIDRAFNAYLTFRLKLSVSRHMMYRTVSTTVASNSMAPGSIVGSESAIVDIVTQLGATFTKLIELMLSKEIKVHSISNLMIGNFANFKYTVYRLEPYFLFFLCS